MTDYSNWDNTKLTDHAWEIATIIEPEKAATANLINALATRLKELENEAHKYGDPLRDGD